jgi:hypothetical protein
MYFNIASIKTAFSCNEAIAQTVLEIQHSKLNKKSDNYKFWARKVPFVP